MSGRRPRRYGSWALAGAPALALAALPWIDAAWGWWLPAAQALLPLLSLAGVLAAVGFAVARGLVATGLLLTAALVSAAPALIDPPHGDAKAVLPGDPHTASVRVLSLNAELGGADAAALAGRRQRV